MSLFREAQVTFLLADFANIDPMGKLNVIGGDLRFIGEVSPGASAPFCLVVMVAIPVKYAGTEFAMTIDIHDVTIDRPVSLPGEAGTLQPLRAQQVVTVNDLQLGPGIRKPEDAFTGANMVMNFANGLPLTPGHSFEARVQIDGQSRHWFYRFHVLAQAPGVIFGGPMNPPVIPGIGDYVVPSDSDDDGGPAEQV